MAPESSVRIGPARDPRDLDVVRELFREYANGLGFDLAYQGFARELIQLPGCYAPPFGELLIAKDIDDLALGCVGLRPLDLAGVCELKRLFVRPAARGAGLGPALARSAAECARTMGYRRIVLDTLPSMASAISLYRALGFTPIPAYSRNTVPDLLYFGKELAG